MSYSHTTRYRTTNWSEYNASLKQRGSLTLWIDPNLTWRAPRTGMRGRQQIYSDKAIQFCLTPKVVFGLALRQTIGFAASLLKLMGMNVPVPDFSTLCRRQDKLAVAIPYRGSTGPLHLLINSTGVKVEGDGEWMARTTPANAMRQSRSAALAQSYRHARTPASGSRTVPARKPETRRYARANASDEALAKMERVSPTQSCRDENELS